MNDIRVKTINNHCVMVYNYSDESATIFSYDTPVFRVDADNSLHRLWNGWSATTQRDINTATNHCLNINKKMWEAMPIE